MYITDESLRTKHRSHFRIKRILKNSGRLYEDYTIYYIEFADLIGSCDKPCIAVHKDYKGNIDGCAIKIENVKHIRYDDLYLATTETSYKNVTKLLARVDRRYKQYHVYRNRYNMKKAIVVEYSLSDIVKVNNKKYKLVV